MTTLQIESEVVVPASAAAVYRVLMDYAGARRELHAIGLARLPGAVADRALQDSLWPHPLDTEQAATLVPAPAVG